MLPSAFSTTRTQHCTLSLLSACHSLTPPPDSASNPQKSVWPRCPCSGHCCCSWFVTEGPAPILSGASRFLLSASGRQSVQALYRLSSTRCCIPASALAFDLLRYWSPRALHMPAPLLLSTEPSLNHRSGPLGRNTSFPAFHRQPCLLQSIPLFFSALEMSLHYSQATDSQAAPHTSVCLQACAPVRRLPWASL